MRKARMILCAGVFAVCSGAVSGADASAGRTSADDAQACFRQMERDIPSLYLLNGLNLSREQASALSKVLTRVSDAEKRLAREGEKVIARREQDMEREVEGIVKLAAQRRDVEIRIDTPLRGGRMAEARRDLWALRSEYDEVANAAAAEVDELLTAAQGRILDSFKPCFIPANDFRNPERVGQVSGDTTVTEKALASVRKAPAGHERGKAVEAALDVLVPHVMYERHLAYSAERAQTVRKELRPLFEGAAQAAGAMSDADFELEKKRLAQGVVPAEEGRRARSDADIWKIRHYVLNTSLCDVIKDRAEGASTPRVACTPSLDARDLAGRRRDYAKAASLLGELDLSVDQATRLLPIARGAVKAIDELDEKALREMESAQAPYGRLRGELACGQPTPEGEHGAGRFHHAVRVLHDEERVARLLAYEAELDKVLTRDQVSLLMSDRPEWEDLPPDRAREMREQALENRDATMASARKLLSDARRMSAQAFGKGKDALCRGLLAAEAGTGQAESSAGVDAEVARMAAVLDLARGLKRAEYANRREELATDLCPKLATSRPTAYSAKFKGLQPQQTLWSSTRTILSEPACAILARMAR